jgi:hypothetical protein
MELYMDCIWLHGQMDIWIVYGCNKCQKSETWEKSDTLRTSTEDSFFCYKTLRLRSEMSPLWTLTTHDSGPTLSPARTTTTNIPIVKHLVG